MSNATRIRHELPVSMDIVEAQSLNGATLMTIGCDTQEDRLEYEVFGWNQGGDVVFNAPFQVPIAED